MEEEIRKQRDAVRKWEEGKERKGKPSRARRAIAVELSKQRDAVKVLGE